MSEQAIIRWSVTMDGSEPTIADEELAERLGYARPRDIRKLIECLIAEGILNDSDIRARRSRVVTGVSSVAITQYHLTESGARLVISRCNTKIARALRQQIAREVADLCTAARRGQLPLPEQIPVMSTAPLIGDSSVHRAEVAKRCRWAASRSGTSVQRIHGEMRRQWHVNGIYHIQLVFLDRVREFLTAVEDGHITLAPRSRRQLAAGADPRQGVLPFPVERTR